jgi:uncharacterized protein (DUF2342 family)
MGEEILLSLTVLHCWVLAVMTEEVGACTPKKATINFELKHARQKRNS